MITLCTVSMLLLKIHLVHFHNDHLVTSDSILTLEVTCTHALANDPDNTLFLIMAQKSNLFFLIEVSKSDNSLSETCWPHH